MRIMRTRAGGMLEARVEGSGGAWYAVEAEYAPDDGIFDGSCTCPVGVECKHIAATFFAYAAERGVPAEGAAFRASFAHLGEREVDAWMREIEAAHRGAERAATRVSPPELVYLVDERAPGKLPIRALTAARLKSGKLGAPRDLAFASLALSYAAYAAATDLQIGALATALERTTGDAAPRLDLARTLIAQLVASERLRFEDHNGPILRAGAPRETGLVWALLDGGSQRLTIRPPTPRTHVFARPLPWYVDSETDEAGLLELGADAHLVAPLVAGPIVSASGAARVRGALAKFPALAFVPPPATEVRTEVVAERPEIRLVVCTGELDREGHARLYGGALPYDETRFVDHVRLSFRYGDDVTAPAVGPDAFRTAADGRLVVRPRDAGAERAALATLTDLGFYRTYETGTPPDPERAAAFRNVRSGASTWLHFVHREAPRLEAAGWTIAVDPSFRHVVAEPDDETAELALTEGTGGWFDCEVGIRVDGERISLLPVLLELFRREPRETQRLLARSEPDRIIYVPLGDRHLALPTERIRRFFELFTEYLDPQGTDDEASLPLARAATLAHTGDERLRVAAPDRLRALGAKLADFTGIAAVAPPAGLRAELRPYQQAGVNWLQFLREYGLAGILADDMGLGKTVQTLAHLLIEKEAGRLARPALLVVPTSLVPNWVDEAARFAPSLRVLSLHGADRGSRFGTIAESDLVITTYPLLARDEVLQAQPWALVVLDEAQTVKNAQTKAARTARLLQTEHRLCLTGTPIENHLGELWAQFDFLMPGLLGSAPAFTRRFRTPIEKQGDASRRSSLVRRIRPFVLRRTKSDVALELPEKTEIVRRVEFGDEQRDLYETLRLAMHERVRREVASVGLARSRIVILDAILKLRQACCDPRLVKTAVRKRAYARGAKLDLLCEMLPELIEDGRRILIFSQFTSFLDLLEPELERLAIPYVQIRGTTKDRRTPVARFQAGEAPVFLISLKAGGTGLNLTAADVVLHLDPWWNPAVENQATDRAHRIGQKHAVFVYKLIVARSIEERILALQARKAAIAAGVFGESNAPFSLEAADLEDLFAPLD